MKTVARMLVVGCAIALASGLACSRCQKSSARPLDTVPANAAVVVQLSPLGALAPTLKQGLELAQGEAQLAELSMLEAQLGFDPTKIEGLKQAGLDPARPALMIALTSEDEPVFALPVDDPKVFEGTARRLARGLGRADKVTEPKVAGRPGLRFARSFGDREVLLATVVVVKERGVAYVATDDDGAEHIERLLNTKPEEGLGRSTRLAAAQKKVRTGPLLVWAAGPAAVELSQGLGGGAEAVGSIVASAGADGAYWLDAFVGLSVDARKRMAKTMDPQASAPDMLSLADHDAVAIGAGSVSTTDLFAELKQRDSNSASNLEEVARRMGLDLDAEVLKRLQGGFGAILYLRDVRPLATALTVRDPRLSSPSQLMHTAGQAVDLFAIATLTEAGAKEIPEVMMASFNRRGIEVTSRTSSFGPVSTVVLGGEGQAATEFSYALRANQLVVGVGQRSRFDVALGRLAKKTTGELSQTLNADLKKLLGSGSSGLLYISFSALATKLHALAAVPSLASPSAQSAIGKVGEAIAQLGALGIVTRLEEDGLRIQTRMELSPRRAGSAAP